MKATFLRWANTTIRSTKNMLSHLDKVALGTFVVLVFGFVFYIMYLGVIG